MYDILFREELAAGQVMFVIKAKSIADKAVAGQFVIIRLSEEGERIPLTIADYSKKDGTITLIVQDIGKTTRDLCRKEKGGNIPDIAGPLGKPSHIQKYGTVAGIGGGVGIAVVYLWAKSMKEAGNRVISILGARDKEHLFWEKKISSVSDKVIITTDNGSYGRKGLVTGALEDLASEERIDHVFAVGPTVMMQAVAQTTRQKGIKTTVSLNPIMVDGTGMCGACRTEVAGKTCFVCVDGPDFDAHEVDFEMLRSRQKIYNEEERMV